MSEIVLNQNQQAVLEAGLSPILVLAGPGSGKTTLLSAKIQWSLANSNYDRVLAITFTNIAASNLRRRLEALGVQAFDRVRVSTFHSFAATVLQQHGVHINLSPDFAISNDESDRKEILTKALVDAGLEIPDDNPLPLISRLLERGVRKETIRALIDGSLDASYIWDMISAYITTSIELSQLDFSLLLYLVNMMLSKRPAIARQLRRTYKYICVDEFQDTNDAQFELLSRICDDSASGLILLADQDQVIYQWNGASIRRLHDAVSIFQAKVLELPTSHRCPETILTAANRLISHNANRFTRPKFQSTEEGGSIVVKSFPNDIEENNWIIAQLIKLAPSELENVAILSRGRKKLERLLRALREAGISAAIPASQFEFQAPPIVALYSFLRLAQKYQRRHLDQLVRSLNVIYPVQLDSGILEAEAAIESRTVLDHLVFTIRAERTSAAFLELLSYVELELVPRKEFYDFTSLALPWLAEILQREPFFAQELEQEQEMWVALDRQHKGLRSDRITLSEYLRRMALEAKSPPISDTVRLMTVHGAKGLEYERVFIACAVEGEFPNFQAAARGAESDEVQEERRSFFVAITRARSEVVITYPLVLNGFAKKPSRFIGELGVVQHM